MMRIVVLLFVFFCACFHFYFVSKDQPVIAAIYNVGTLVIASILACTSDRR